MGLKKPTIYSVVAVASLLLFVAVARGGSKAGPAFASVTVAPFVVETHPLEGAPVRPDEAAFLARLSEEATVQAERTLRDRRIAGSVGRAPTEGTAAVPLVLTGRLRLPVSLPPGLTRFNASSRKEVFATALISVRDGTGKTVASEEVGLRWKDVRWIRGAKVRRNRPLEMVLIDFTRKSVDRAVRRLTLALSDSGRQEAGT